MRWARSAEPTRAVLLEALGEDLLVGDERLLVVLGDALGEEGPIDLVARDGAGRAVVVRFADRGDDARALTEVLGQRAWLAPRLRDWQRLAPSSGVRADLGVRALLVAPSFSAATLAAAGRIGDVELARARGLESQGVLLVALEPCTPAAPPTAPRVEAGPARARPGAPAPARTRPAEPPPQRAAERVAAPPFPLSAPAGPEEPIEVPGTFRTGLDDEALGLPRRPRNTPRTAG